MTAVAAIGRPMRPSSMTARAVWVPVPSTVSGADPTRTPGDGRGIHHPAPARQIDRERLLAVHMLAVRDGRERDVGVRGGDREVQHDVDVGIGEQRRHLEGPGAGDAGRHGRGARHVEVGDRRHLERPSAR